MASEAQVVEAPTSIEPTLDKMLESGPRVMWVAAHPDDESFVGPVLAKAVFVGGSPLHLVVLTHGEGGADHRKGEKVGTVAEARQAELKEVAKLYKATLRHEGFFNAPLPVKSFPKRHEIAQRWAEEGDPIQVVAEEIRSFRPDVLLTLSPIVGGTGHPEHQIAARFAIQGIRRAADEGAEVPGEPHRVEHVYFMLNKYWFFRIVPGGFNDPLPVTEIFDPRQLCPDGRTCAQIMAEHTRPHKTQDKDMGGMRLVAKFMKKIYLHKTDPFVGEWDPFEPREQGGMG